VDLDEGGEALEQVAQRSCGCPLPGSVQGQVGWGCEQLALVEGVPAHGTGVGLRWSLEVLSNPKQSMILLEDSNILPLLLPAYYVSRVFSLCLLFCILMPFKLSEASHW